MTFQAISAAVTAYHYSIPVISVDACTIKCSHIRAVLMSATFQTTDGHLLSMCFGTASESNESWCFFMMNLRQALTKYCTTMPSYRQIVFVSDRHKSIVKGVEAFFPESKHIYCVVHLKRNITSSGLESKFFWRAVEAISIENSSRGLVGNFQKQIK